MSTGELAGAGVRNNGPPATIGSVEEDHRCSHLNCNTSGASFHGHLDIQTLGGAGFASQRTANDDCHRHWELASFAGLEVAIDLSQSDNHMYTLILKDTVLPRNPVDGREQSTVSWEAEFSKADCRVEHSTRSHTRTASLFIPWDRFKPTYRGKPCGASQPLDLSNIKRIAIMIRSFFGSQEGDFCLGIISIAGCSSPGLEPPTPCETCTNDQHAGA
ncbi:hypothetical protein A1O3_05960 [Capronia epimyces CBS 606.96]|uniref:NADH:ubiquinone oxidoreductase intermediate-associated protein 30 domain-containing protein n=1 Tax=Capronia epimyces CBS 606.96 TaxID=1182542 RepID=W9Y6M6_9EURO|nr:uncharacterized protein A1O3_05960 [Capronia epimyces CBS 606.96]EXJ85285.1 hypothetical protein A1O3_05960 [Capronia epimyces CBS 606.96]